MDITIDSTTGGNDQEPGGAHIMANAYRTDGPHSLHLTCQCNSRHLTLSLKTWKHGELTVPFPPANKVEAKNSDC